MILFFESLSFYLSFILSDLTIFQYHSQIKDFLKRTRLLLACKCNKETFFKTENKN